MVNIEGIQVDIITGINSLSREWAVFTVEFEFDSRLIVCHTFNSSVYRGIKNLINQILSVKAKSIELRQALLNSRYITVNIEKYNLATRNEVLSLKYDLIKRNKCYLPYGYNVLIGTGSSLEQRYADILMADIIDEIDKNATYPREPIHDTSKRGRTPKPVYSYDKHTGMLVQEYVSIKDASEQTGLCASNISMCCNGHVKTAGKYIWSYILQPVIDINRHKDNRFKDAIIPSEADIVERQLKFIQNHLENQKEYETE